MRILTKTLEKIDQINNRIFVSSRREEKKMRNAEKNRGRTPKSFIRPAVAEGSLPVLLCVARYELGPKCSKLAQPGRRCKHRQSRTRGKFRKSWQRRGRKSCSLPSSSPLFLSFLHFASPPFSWFRHSFGLLCLFFSFLLSDSHLIPFPSNFRSILIPYCRHQKGSEEKAGNTE